MRAAVGVGAGEADHTMRTQQAEAGPGGETMSRAARLPATQQPLHTARGDPMASRAVPPGASQRAGALGEQRKQRGDVQRAGGKSGHDGVTGAGSARIDAMEAEAGQARCGRVLARTPPEDMPCEALVGSMPGGPSARPGRKRGAGAPCHTGRIGCAAARAAGALETALTSDGSWAPSGGVELRRGPGQRRREIFRRVRFSPPKPPKRQKTHPSGQSGGCVGHVSKVSSRLADQGATLRRLAAGTRRRPRLGARRGGPQCARVAGSIQR